MSIQQIPIGTKVRDKKTGEIGTITAKGFVPDPKTKSLGVKKIETPTYTKKAPSGKGIFSRTAEQIGTSFNVRQQKMQEILQRSAVREEQSPLSAGVEIFGQAAKTVEDVGGSLLEAGVRTAYEGGVRARSLVEPETVEELKQKDFETANLIGEGLLKSPIGQVGVWAFMEGAETWNRFQETNPNTAGIISGVANTVDLASLFVGGKVATKGAKMVEEGLETGTEQILKAGGKTLDVAKPFTESVQNIGSQAIKKGGEVVSGTKTVLEEGGRKAGIALKNAPSNIATSAEASKAARMELQQLPKPAQEAVKKGVDYRDAQLLSESFTEVERKVSSEMLEAAEQFGKSRSAKDPSVIGGAIVTERLYDLEAIVDDFGKELGEVADELPVERLKGIRDEVMLRLRKTPGLENIRMLPNGKLDFSNTNLSSALTRTDREAIQKAWDATKGRGGKKLHQLRQELFDVINGEKRGMVVKTQLRDDGINAIRMGISDSLDTFSRKYAAMNMKYAKARQPYEQLVKFFRKLEDQGEDVLSERGASLLRKLSSRQQSAPEMRAIFNRVENALEEFGKKSDVNLDKIQHFYDALQRNFDITPDQSLGGQLRIADVPMSSRGIIDKTLGTIIESAGTSPATRRKAFKELFKANKEITDELPKVKGATAPKAVKEAVGEADEVLMKEAKKYKSAEEFVKANYGIKDLKTPENGKNVFNLTDVLDNKELYRKYPELSGYKIRFSSQNGELLKGANAGVIGRDIVLSDNMIKKTADITKANILEKKLQSFIEKESKGILTKEEYLQASKIQDELSNLINKPGAKIELTDDALDSLAHEIQHIKQSNRGVKAVKDDILSEFAKKNPEIKMSDYYGNPAELEARVAEGKIKTKSQLTDIWNKANKK